MEPNTYAGYAHNTTQMTLIDISVQKTSMVCP